MKGLMAEIVRAAIGRDGAKLPFHSAGKNCGVL
jgi:hypothetical protein